MQIISSRQNPQIKAVAALAQAKERKARQQFVAEGIRTVTTLMKSMEPLELYMTKDLYDQRVARIDPKKIYVVTAEVMEKISSATTPSGIVGVFAIPRSEHKPLTKGLVLANVQNPGNMGTLIRTAAAMGARSVVVVDGVDPWHPKVIQATAGTIAQLNIHELSWQELLDQRDNLKLCALVADGGQSAQLLSQEDILIVVGNEATGIPKAWLEQCDLTCTLPMPGNTESLNAAIAGSIALYLAFIPKAE